MQSTWTWSTVAEQFAGEELNDLGSGLEGLFKAVGAAALADYGLENSILDKVAHLNHSDYQSVKYACRVGEARYLLSLYVPTGAIEDMDGLPHIEAYLRWLEALDRDFARTVQRPLRNRSGELLARVEIAGVAPATLCALLHWVPGTPLDEDDEEPLPEATVYQMGELLAHIHQHSSGWARPEGFPVNSSHDLAKVVERLGSLQQQGTVTAEDSALVERLVAKIEGERTVWAPSAEHWGLLHGDFHAGNCLLHEGRLYPIDFEGSNLGYFLSDVAWCMLMQEFDPAAIGAFIDGYNSIRPLAADYQPALEGLILQDALWFIAEYRAVGQLPALVAREGEKYLAGEPFLFDAQRSWLE